MAAGRTPAAFSIKGGTKIMRTQTEERGTITLNKPVLINGVQVAEMSYDTDEISGELYAQAEAHKMKASGSKGGNLAGAVELDYSLHLYIGFAAVIAVNPSYTFEDMERIKGKSLTKFSKIGRGFFIGSGDSGADSSDEQSETTPEPSTPVRRSSKGKE